MSRLVLCLPIALWLAVAPPQTAEAQLMSEDVNVKAAFLVNVVNFTEWPAAIFSSHTAPVIVGVAGDERVRFSIARLAVGRTFNERTIETRNVKESADTAGVHILFVSALMDSPGPDILKSVRGLPVLTVGDSNSFCENGGMIRLLVEQERLRFEISVGATELAGLKVSSRVLTLAKTVYGNK